MHIYTNIVQEHGKPKSEDQLTVALHWSDRGPLDSALNNLVSKLVLDYEPI